LPWQSRHKGRRDQAALITILVVLGIGIVVLISANLPLIGRFFVIFTPHG
jgi:hypothetical protein